MRIPIFLMALFLMSCADKKVATEDHYEFVELPDGSLVYLNHHSSVSFDEDFENRNIKLLGEAYFKVEKGDVPFIISTPESKITITGTELNVNTKNDELEVEVTEGEVEVDSEGGKKTVKSGQRAVKKSGANLEIKKAERKFSQWMKDLSRELKKAGRAINKESKKAGKAIDKESEKAEKELKKIFN